MKILHWCEVQWYVQIQDLKWEAEALQPSLLVYCHARRHLISDTEICSHNCLYSVLPVHWFTALPFGPKWATFKWLYMKEPIDWLLVSSILNIRPWLVFMRLYLPPDCDSSAISCKLVHTMGVKAECSDCSWHRWQIISLYECATVECVSFIFDEQCYCSLVAFLLVIWDFSMWILCWNEWLLTCSSS